MPAQNYALDVSEAPSAAGLHSNATVRTRTHTRTDTHTSARAHTHTHKRARTHTHTHSLIHSFIHSFIHFRSVQILRMGGSDIRNTMGS